MTKERHYGASSHPDEIAQIVKLERPGVHPKMLKVMQAVRLLNMAIRECEEDLDTGYIVLETGGINGRVTAGRLNLTIKAVCDSPSFEKVMRRQELDKQLNHECDRKAAIEATRNKRSE